MRSREFNWLGERFVYLNLEAEPGGSLDRQSQGMFERAGAELAARGLSMTQNVVRTRVFGRTREARDVVSDVRGTKSETGIRKGFVASFQGPLPRGRPAPSRLPPRGMNCFLNKVTILQITAVD
jgi:hypothetical protein